MSLQTELEAIRTTAAISPLTDRAFLRITGTDATRWLNGMVTNSVKDLAPGEGNYNFLLNAQGRIQADATIYREPGEGEATFLLETDKSQIETIQTLLDKFIIMDDVVLMREFSDSHSLLLIIGKEAHAIIQSLGLPAMQPGRISRGSGFDFAYLLTPVTTLLDAPKYEFYSSASGIAQLIDTLKPSCPELSPAALEAHRILSATPKYGQDIRNTETAKDLPQETAQTHALHFNKGCYLGQEIVERIRSRGQVHRTFTAFTLTGAMPQLPAPLESNGKPAGELTSAIQIGDTLHALGYLRREFATQPLTYPGGTATLHNPS